MVEEQPWVGWTITPPTTLPLPRHIYLVFKRYDDLPRLKDSNLANTEPTALDFQKFGYILEYFSRHHQERGPGIRQNILYLLIYIYLSKVELLNPRQLVILCTPIVLRIHIRLQVIVLGIDPNLKKASIPVKTG